MRVPLFLFWTADALPDSKTVHSIAIRQSNRSGQIRCQNEANMYLRSIELEASIIKKSLLLSDKRKKNEMS